jgi:two-component system response regulator RegA
VQDSGPSAWLILTDQSDSFRTVLVVDDDQLFLRSLTKLLARLGVEEIVTAPTVEEAIAKLDAAAFELLMCDLCLDLADGIAVIEHARTLDARPTVIAMSGAASREQVFDLMTRGVSAFLEKPFGAPQLASCLQRAADASRVLTDIVRAEVGRVGAKEAQQLVRETMYREALALTGGNRHAAARLLRVDRRLVQLMAQELTGDLSGSEPPSTA